MGKFFESLGFKNVEPNIIASFINHWNHISVGDDVTLSPSAFWCEHRLTKKLISDKYGAEAKIEYNGDIFVANWHNWWMTVSRREKVFKKYTGKYEIEYVELPEIPAEFADLILGIFLFNKHKIRFVKPRKDIPLLPKYIDIYAFPTAFTGYRDVIPPKPLIDKPVFIYADLLHRWCKVVYDNHYIYRIDFTSNSDTEIVNGCIVIDADIMKGKRDKLQSNAILNWNKDPAILKVYHYTNPHRLFDNIVERYKVSLDRDFLNELKCKQIDVLNLYKSEEYRVKLLNGDNNAKIRLFEE